MYLYYRYTYNIYIYMYMYIALYTYVYISMCVCVTCVLPSLNKKCGPNSTNHPLVLPEISGYSSSQDWGFMVLGLPD